MSSKEGQYIIYLYTSPSGKEVVKNFIHRLNNKTKVRIRNALRLLSQYGLQLLTTAWVKKICSNPSIYELRITEKIQVRLFFFQYNANTFVVTNVFIKKQPKTPKKELITSIKRAKEFLWSWSYSVKPSIALLERIAQALGAKLEIKFTF